MGLNASILLTMTSFSPATITYLSFFFVVALLFEKNDVFFRFPRRYAVALPFDEYFIFASF